MIENQIINCLKYIRFCKIATQKTHETSLFSRTKPKIFREDPHQLLSTNKKQSYEHTLKGYGLEATISQKNTKKPGSIVPTLSKNDNKELKVEQFTYSIEGSFEGRNKYTIFSSLFFDCAFVHRFPPHFLRLDRLFFVFKIILLLAKLCTCSVAHNKRLAQHIIFRRNIKP